MGPATQKLSDNTRRSADGIAAPILISGNDEIADMAKAADFFATSLAQRERSWPSRSGRACPTRARAGRARLRHAGRPGARKPPSPPRHNAKEWAMANLPLTDPRLSCRNKKSIQSSVFDFQIVTIIEGPLRGLPRTQTDAPVRRVVDMVEKGL
jgi:hypothetical protein